jgi:hypothetical protein
MPRGPSRPWKAVAPHTKRAIPYINAAIQAGYDVELKITDVEDDEMPDFRRGLFNAAKLTGVSVHVDKARKADGTWTLTYAVHDKTKARAHILAKHGTDRQQWPYNPRRPSPRNETGERTDV